MGMYIAHAMIRTVMHKKRNSKHPPTGSGLISPEATPESTTAPAPVAAARPRPIAEPEAAPEEASRVLCRPASNEFEQATRTSRARPAAALWHRHFSLGDQVFLDIGYKTEAFCPAPPSRTTPKASTRRQLPFPSPARNEEHYYVLSRFKVSQPRDWSALETPSPTKPPSVGTVTEVRKGGFTVDVGVPAFMPASRSGTHDEARLQKLVGTEILDTHHQKLDVTSEDVVVDRASFSRAGRGLVEAPPRSSELRAIRLCGTVPHLVPYGAFIELVASMACCTS